MTLSSQSPKGERGRLLKQDRLDRQDRVAKRFPWLMPAIVVLAALIVAAGIVLAVIVTGGHLF